MVETDIGTLGGEQLGKSETASIILIRRLGRWWIEAKNKLKGGHEDITREDIFIIIICNTHIRTHTHVWTYR